MDTGLYAEALIGIFFQKYISVEFGLGWLDGDGGKNDVKADVKSIPLFLNLKGTLPIKNVGELYAGVGMGIYFTDLEIETGSSKLDEGESIFGGHGFLGIHFHITPTQFIGIEGKYINTEVINIDGHSFDIDGWTLTINFSVRLK